MSARACTGGGLVAAILLVCLAQARQTQNPPAEATLRAEVRLINVYVTVKDSRGQLVRDLSAGDFKLLDDGQPQEIMHFDRESGTSVLAILLMDTSTSQARILAQETQIATQFLEQILRPGDLAMLAAFDSNAYLLQGPTPDVAQVARAFEHVRPFAPGFAEQLPPAQKTNGSRVCDALAWAAALTSPRSDSRKVIILVSDGVDAELDTRLKPALEAALGYDVVVYAIRVLDWKSYPGGQARVEVGERALQRLARETGGQYYRGDDARELAAALRQVATEVRGQYSLSFMPRHLTYSGRLHPITISVNRSHAAARARRGYFSPRP